MRGRNSKFTPENKKKLTDLISVGSTDKDACGACNIATSTFYEWLEIGRAAQSGKPHRNMPEAEEDKQSYSDFSDEIIRARATANNAAMIAVKSGLRETQIVEDTTESFSEIRLKKNADGSESPYEYRRTTTRSTVRKQPPDWRAGIEYLKRRSPDEWSEKHRVQIETWRDAYIRAIQNGEVDYPSLVEVLQDDSLAAELFKLAGVNALATGESENEETQG